MIKAVAGILIIFSCSGFGFVKAAEIYGRIKFLEKIRRMLIHLKGEINYAKTPLMEAFYSISEKETGILREFCIEVAEEINMMEGKRFGDIWSEKTEKKLIATPLEKKDIEDFMVIGEKLGYQDYKMQIAAIDLEIQYMEEKICSLKEVVIQKQKVYRALGVFSGLMITILFL